VNMTWHCTNCNAYRDPQSLDYETGLCGDCQDKGVVVDMPQRLEAVIRLHSYEPFVITTQEYEELQKELICRAHVDDMTLGDKILARLLQEHHSRYRECKERNAVLLDNAQPEDIL